MHVKHETKISNSKNNAKMIYITQIIYVKAGKEQIFDEFEAMAIPIIAKYGGELLLRSRPGVMREGVIEAPSEIHIITFPSELQFEEFRNDEGRKAFLHLKEESVKKSILILGRAI
jgi:uncharacterized protein (DUF1330 family)